MYLAMDAGLKGSDNDVQVLLVYDKQSGKLEHCLPSDLKNELDGVAFKASLGEFSFMLRLQRVLCLVETCILICCR